MKNKVKDIIFPIIMFVICFASFCIISYDKTEPQTNTETVYMICDVYSLTEDAVEIIQPNGSIHSYDMPMDAPEEFEEVVIKTDNIDDYSTYEIVGLR